MKSLLPDEQHTQARAHADLVPQLSYPIQEESAREHVGNAVQILQAAPQTALGGRYLSPEDARAITMRLVAALKELDRHLVSGKRP